MSRAEEAARRAELAAAQERGESRQAQELIDAFVLEARARGIAPEPLRATLYSGQSVKTDKVGWYLRKNQSLAIGDDGAYYVLTVPGGLRERISGVKLKPSAAAADRRQGRPGRRVRRPRGVPALAAGSRLSESRSSRAQMSSRVVADRFTLTNFM